MPARRTSDSTFSRRVAPFAPLAVALLLNNAVITPRTNPAATLGTAAEVNVCEAIDDFHDCHDTYATGCTRSERGHYDPYLNVLKNALRSPQWKPNAVEYHDSLNDFTALDRGLPDDLKKGNHEEHKEALASLGEGRLAGMVGYLYYAEKMGEESTNCQLDGEPNVDYHIGIGFNATLAKTILARKGRLDKDDARQMKRTSIIVEMTPHYREQLQPNWNIEDIRAIRGRKVRVAGQLLVDNEHNVPSQNCALPGADRDKCWRASAWELHPVTKFQVCGEDDPANCTATSGRWLELEDAVSN